MNPLELEMRKKLLAAVSRVTQTICRSFARPSDALSAIIADPELFDKSLALGIVRAIRTRMPLIYLPRTTLLFDQRYDETNWRAINFGVGRSFVERLAARSKPVEVGSIFEIDAADVDVDSSGEGVSMRWIEETLLSEHLFPEESVWAIAFRLLGDDACGRRGVLDRDRDNLFYTGNHEVRASYDSTDRNPRWVVSAGDRSRGKRHRSARVFIYVSSRVG